MLKELNFHGSFVLGLRPAGFVGDLVVGLGAGFHVGDQRGAVITRLCRAANRPGQFRVGLPRAANRTNMSPFFGTTFGTRIKVITHV
jgi:hypothetical protein